MCVCVLEGFNDQLCDFGCKLDHCLTLTHTKTHTHQQQQQPQQQQWVAIPCTYLFIVSWFKMLFQSPQSQPPLMHLARCIEARFVSQCRKEISPPLISDLAPHIWCTSFVRRYQGIGAPYRYPGPLLIGYVYVRTWNHRFGISTSRAMCESGTMGAGPAHGSCHTITQRPE